MIEIKERYKEILEKQLEEGLTRLEDISITDEHYRDLVVNINNAMNIITQLTFDIEKLKELESKETNETEIIIEE